MEKEKKENWFKRHKKLSIGLLIFVIIIGFGTVLQEKEKCDMAKAVMPNSFIFNSDFKINNTWNDGTEIKTLKSYSNADNSGFLTTYEQGKYKFYKGNKTGQNVNQYYIDSSITKVEGLSSDSRYADFYLEYSKVQGTDANGNVLPNKYFKIIPKKYNIEFKDNQYYMILNEYSCK